jgi:hypothetical protein
VWQLSRHPLGIPLSEIKIGDNMINRIRTTLLQVLNTIGFGSPEMQFDRAFSVFKKVLARKLPKRMSELSAGLAQLGATYGRTGKGDPISGRFDLFKTHSENIGNDFLDCLKKNILANCRNVPSGSVSAILKEISQIYLGAMVHARDAYSRYVHSIGRPNDLDVFYKPTEQTYSSALSSYTDLIQSEIEEFNLNSTHNKLEARRQKIIGLLIQAISYVLTFILGVLLGKWISCK